MNFEALRERIKRFQQNPIGNEMRGLHLHATFRDRSAIQHV